MSDDQSKPFVFEVVERPKALPRYVSRYNPERWAPLIAAIVATGDDPTKAVMIPTPSALKNFRNQLAMRMRDTPWVALSCLTEDRQQLQIWAVKRPPADPSKPKPGRKKHA